MFVVSDKSLLICALLQKCQVTPTPINPMKCLNGPVICSIFRGHKQQVFSEVSLYRVELDIVSSELPPGAWPQLCSRWGPSAALQGLLFLHSGEHIRTLGLENLYVNYDTLVCSGKDFLPEDRGSCQDS